MVKPLFLLNASRYDGFTVRVQLGFDWFAPAPVVDSSDLGTTVNVYGWHFGDPSWTLLGSTSNDWTVWMDVPATQLEFPERWAFTATAVLAGVESSAHTPVGVGSWACTQEYVFGGSLRGAAALGMDYATSLPPTVETPGGGQAELSAPTRGIDSYAYAVTKKVSDFGLYAANGYGVKVYLDRFDSHLGGRTSDEPHDPPSAPAFIPPELNLNRVLLIDSPRGTNAIYSGTIDTSGCSLMILRAFTDINFNVEPIDFGGFANAGPAANPIYGSPGPCPPVPPYAGYPTLPPFAPTARSRAYAFITG